METIALEQHPSAILIALYTPLRGILNILMPKLLFKPIKSESSGVGGACISIFEAHQVIKKCSEKLKTVALKWSLTMERTWVLKSLSVGKQSVSEKYPL